MSRPGPTPKPAPLRVVDGTYRADRHGDGGPRPRPVAPKAPTWLPKDARAMWRELSKELEPLGLLTAVDGPAFAATVLTFTLAKQAAIELAEAGAVTDYDDHNDRLRRHPAVQVLRDNLAAYRQWCAEFGLTPAARTRLSTVSGDDGADDILD